MRRLPASVHHRTRSSVERTLLRTIRSTSVSVVELMAPMCTTAVTSPRWLSNQRSKSSGAMRSTISCFARLRQRSSLRSQSHTTTASPLRLSSATRFEPMKPAPPVTTYTLIYLRRRHPGSGRRRADRARRSRPWRVLHRECGPSRTPASSTLPKSCRAGCRYSCRR